MNSNIRALQAVKLIWSEPFIRFFYLHRLILSCSRQTTIQAIEAKLKMMEHSSVRDFEVNNAPAGSLFVQQRQSVSQPSTRRYQSRGRCDSRPYRRPTNHRRWSVSVTVSHILSSDTQNLSCNNLYVCTLKESQCITLWYCFVWLHWYHCCTAVCCQHSNIDICLKTTWHHILEISLLWEPQISYSITCLICMFVLRVCYVKLQEIFKIM